MAWFVVRSIDFTAAADAVVAQRRWRMKPKAILARLSSQGEGMAKTELVFVFVATLFFTTIVNGAQNYPDRKAYVINICPHVEITSFSFANQDRERRTQVVTNYSWRSTAQKPIVAFEIVMLKYDAFDERLIGTRFAVQGTNSVDWSPLPPGGSSSDRAFSFLDEDVFTGISYVRKVRLADGTVWRVDESKLLAELKKVAPAIRDPGSLAPDPKAPAKE